MGPENNFRMLVPRKDDPQGLRPSESGVFQAAYPPTPAMFPASGITGPSCSGTSGRSCLPL